MNKFIPYVKLSKKKKRELDRRRRKTWGSLNPVTRNTANPKAYNRQKARKWDPDDPASVPLCILDKIPDLNLSMAGASRSGRHCRISAKRRITGKPAEDRLSGDGR